MRKEYKEYPSARVAMQNRAERAVWRGGRSTPDEDIAAAVTLTGDLRGAYRLLRSAVEAGEFVRNADGFLDFPPNAARIRYGP